MDIQDFKAGTLRPGYQYRYFLPETVSKEFTWKDAQVNILLEQAAARVGELNAFGKIVPDTQMFIQMHVFKEAIVSSRIEGTRTELEEAFQSEQEIQPERREDWVEVHNYVEAMDYAVKRMQDLPFSNRLLREAHQRLMQGVRGENKSPGAFRMSQNWIGGVSLQDAIFIPPSQEHVDGCMSDLELFLMDEENKTPNLIKAAIGHYQFETIHPFLDGNGRVGRLMITLYLVQAGILNKPLLYLSDFFEHNKSLYYDNLMRVRTKNDLRHWIIFFLIGVRDTAEKAIRILNQVRELKEKYQVEFLKEPSKRAQHAHQLLVYLWSQPVVNAATVQSELGMGAKAANALLAYFVEKGLLEEITGYRRNRQFAFRKYIALFE